MVSGAREDLQATVGSLSRRALQAVRLLIERRRSTLERLARNRAFNVAPNKVRELEQRFDEATLRMSQSMRRYLTAIRHRERVLQMRLVKVDLRQTIARNREVLAGKRNRLHSAARTWLQSRRSRLELQVGRIHALSPLAILGRGYAICRNEQGAILRETAGIVCGDRVEVMLARGQLGCRVEQIKP
jgi:exodeoxyribonuclease VII large subunit